MKRMFGCSVLWSACVGILIVALAPAVSAESISVSDGDGNQYTNAMGLAVDFDSTAAANADWTPDLVAGQTYNVNSLSVREVSGTPGDVYLGVYTGYANGALSGFLGASTNAVDFSTNTNLTFVQFNFSGITVTVDSTVSTGTAALPGGGSGMLFFAFQTDALPQATVGTVRAYQRIDGAGPHTLTNYLAAVLDSANAGAFNTRSPEYRATITPVPEPTAAAMLAIPAMAWLAARRRVRD
jgi:hypothetical protein